MSLMSIKRISFVDFCLIVLFDEKTKETKSKQKNNTTNKKEKKKEEEVRRSPEFSPRDISFDLF